MPRTRTGGVNSQMTKLTNLPVLNTTPPIRYVRPRHSQYLVLPVMLCKLIAQWNVRYEVCKNDDEGDEFDHRQALLDCLLRGSVGMRFPYGFPNAVSSASSGIPTASFTDSPAAAKAVDCALLSGQDAIPIATVGLGERVDPAHAPHPSNEGERLLFRQLYETLIQMDCAGNPMPGLAAFWRLDASRKTWSVALRPDARFSDDTPVTTADVVASWIIGGSGSELRPEVRRLVQSIVAVDDRTLEITLRSQRADAPLALAHTDLAVAKSVPGSPWPLGTRPARIDPRRRGASVCQAIRHNR